MTGIDPYFLSPTLKRPALGMEEVGQFNAAANAALEEALRARTIHASMYSAHEGFAIMMEEFDELKEHVWMNQKKRDIAAMRKEAIQIAAMALAFAVEVCNEERGRR